MNVQMILTTVLLTLQRVRILKVHIRVLAILDIMEMDVLVLVS